MLIIRSQLHLVTLLLAAPLFAQQTASQWIWYPESAPNECVNQSRWFRKSFDLPGNVKSASLWLMVDDGCRLWVSGQGPLRPTEVHGAACRYDLSKLLQPGRNLVAIEAYNGPGPAGVIARLVIRLKDEREIVVSSDSTWRASRTPQPGWDEAGFDDATWAAAKSIGGAYKPPWFDIPAFYVQPFITEAEAQAYKSWQATILKAPPSLAREKPARAELIACNGAPTLFINGAPRPAVMYRGTVDPFDEHGRRQIANFRDAGIHVFCTETRIEKHWVAPGKYDFSPLDDCLRAYLSVDPRAYLLLQVRLIPPTWWMDSHPTEWVAYGTSDKLDHSDESYRVKRASPASEVWRKDAGEAWRALIRHLEGQPWGKRVIGYHASYGIYSEWHYFGSWSDQYPDTGAAMTRTFRQWLRDKYGEVEKLRQAWHDPQVLFDTATVPGVEPRETASLIAFRDPAKERRVTDYYHCHQKVIADDIEYFGKIAKQETGRRVIYGVYYGYFFGVRPQTQGGHLELERLLRSPSIDYFVAPYDYGHRLMGEDGRLRSLAVAINLGGKVHLIESDIRTHLHPVDEYGRAQNLVESLAAIRREFTTSLTEHTGFWYVDFGPEMQGGWFDHPQIMSEIAGLQKLAKRALTVPRQSVAQIALVCDLESSYSLSDGEGMSVAERMVSEVGTEMYHLGAPFDGLLLAQLQTADLSQYRMLVFLNTFSMTDRQAALIERLRKAGRHATVFLWSPGLCGPEDISVKRASRVTGSDLSLIPQRLSSAITVTDLADPLTRHLPRSTEFGFKVASTEPVAGFGDPKQWNNPRSAEDMKESYRRFEVAPIENGVQWTFDTRDSWTDVHFDAPIPIGEGIGFNVQVSGAWSRLTFQYAIKDANWAEFVTPVEPVPSGEWCLREYPLAAFTNAPWAKERPPKAALPLRGMKFVFRGTSDVGPVAVSFSNLRSLRGEVTPKQVCTFGEGVFGPVLIPARDGCRTLGHIAGTDYAGLTSSGGGTGLTVFCAAPFIPREVLAAVMRAAGVHQYDSNPADVVRADSRLVAIHTKEGGRRTIMVPRRSMVTDALTGDPVGRGAAANMLLPPDSTTVLQW